MNEELDPTSTDPEAESQAPAPKKKSAAKKAAKKATKKTAKKAAAKKSAAKKATKKAAKKAAKKAITVKAEPSSEDTAGEIGLQELANKVQADELSQSAEILEEATKGLSAAEEAARVAEELAKAAQQAAEEAQKLAREADLEAQRIEAEALAQLQGEAKALAEADKLEAQSEGDLTEREGSAGENDSKSERPRRREPREKREQKPPPEVPQEASLSELRRLSLSDLYSEVERLDARFPPRATKDQLVYAIAASYVRFGTEVYGGGILQQTGGKQFHLRAPSRSFKAAADDISMPPELVTNHGLRPGHQVSVKIGSTTGGRDRSLRAEALVGIEGQTVDDFSAGTPFDYLTPVTPEERFVLDCGKEGPDSVRLVDVVAPLGKGQRGIIVAPPRGGKTIILKQIAASLQNNHPEAHLIVLLLDERPEEVTDFSDLMEDDVFASTFDESAKRHAEVADLVLERSKRLVEQGKDVVILLDSLTRLARGLNQSISGGPIGSGGVSPKAIAACRKFFGTARAVDEGGSLTILATCLIETENRADDVVFEELKGTGNMEIRLDRILAEQRIFPAIHIPESGTRNDDRLYHAQELPKILEIRRELAALPVGEALELLLRNLHKTENNTALLLQGLR